MVKSRLLKKAAMLHAMHYFLSRTITFTGESAEKLIDGLQRPHLLKYAETQSSTLLGMQISHEMRNLLSETTYAVLDELEKTLSKSKYRDGSWTDIFCVMLVLCICIEAVQVASDSYAMVALLKDPACNLSRSQMCQKLDKAPFETVTGLFHVVYKTRKASRKTGRKSSIGFNPIRNGIRIDSEEGITPQMVDLVRDIKQIMVTHGKYNLQSR